MNLQKPSTNTSSSASRWTTATRHKENPDIASPSIISSNTPSRLGPPPSILHKPNLIPSTPSSATSKKHPPSPSSSLQKKHTSQRKKQPLVLVQDTTTNVPQTSSSSPIGGRQLFKPTPPTPHAGQRHLRETYLPLPADSPLARPSSARYLRTHQRAVRPPEPPPLVSVSDDNDDIEYAPPIPSTYLDEPLFPVLSLEDSPAATSLWQDTPKHTLVQALMRPPIDLSSTDPFLVHSDPDTPKFELDFDFVHDLDTTTHPTQQSSHTHASSITTVATSSPVQTQSKSVEEKEDDDDEEEEEEEEEIKVKVKVKVKVHENDPLEDSVRTKRTKKKKNDNNNNTENKEKKKQQQQHREAQPLEEEDPVGRKRNAADPWKTQCV